jgi:hypothetical protein
MYRVVDTVPYTMRNGLEIELLELSSHCIVCGNYFLTTGSKKRCHGGKNKRGLTRTCRLCRGKYHGPGRRITSAAPEAPPKPKPRTPKLAAQPKPIVVQQPTWIPQPAARAHIELIHSLAAGADGAVFWHSHGQVPRSRCRLVSAQGIAEAGAVSATADGMARYVRVKHRNIGMALAAVHRAPNVWAERKRCVAAVLALGTEIADLAAPPFRPSYVVEVSPGRHEAIYVLDRPAAPEAAQPVANALARATRCVASADLLHPWSIPGLARWPSRAEVDAGWPNAAFSARVVRPYTGERVSLAELAAWLEVLS